MNIKTRVPTFEPHYYLWDSLKILENTESSLAPQTEKLVAKRQPYFVHDMSSEYDSFHLAAYLRDSGIELSYDFWRLCDTWLRDEQNHYIGLREIYHRLYGAPIVEIDQMIKTRKPNFGPIAHLIKDEFSLLVAIAFDEITSARAYAHDRNTFFQLGGEPFLTWVKYAGRDEAVHARNALKLLEHRYSHRADEIPSKVEAICNYELVGEVEYHGTFLFDHDTDDFSKSLLADSGRTLCSYFNQGTAFEKFSAQFQL